MRTATQAVFWGAVTLSSLGYIYHLTQAATRLGPGGDGMFAAHSTSEEKSQDRVADEYRRASSKLAKLSTKKRFSHGVVGRRMINLQKQLSALEQKNQALRHLLAANKGSSGLQNAGLQNSGGAQLVYEQPGGASDQQAFRNGFGGSGQVMVRYAPLP